MQPKATTLTSIKPNQQVVTYFQPNFVRRDAASTGNSNFQGNPQQYTLVSKQLEQYTGSVPKYTKPNLLKPFVRSCLTLNIAHELITPKLLLLIRITPKFFLTKLSPKCC